MGNIFSINKERKGKREKKILEDSLKFILDVPLFKIFMLKDLDRVNPVFWPVFFGFLFVIIGIIFSSFVGFFSLLIWAGGFVLLVYLILLGVFIQQGLK